jgi:hypothetical protein
MYIYIYICKPTESKKKERKANKMTGFMTDWKLEILEMRTGVR